ncbi:MAG: DUF4244 domain-containing protein [Nocardioidaceae bacterium]
MRAIRALRSRESGMVTSEYAVGTVGSCGVAGVLLTLVQSDWFQNFFTSILGSITAKFGF